MKIKIFSGSNKFSLSSEIETYVNSFKTTGHENFAEVNILYSTTPVISKGEYEYCTEIEYSALVTIKFESE